VPNTWVMRVEDREAARLAALADLGRDGAGPELVDAAKLASRLLHAPIAQVNLIGELRQHTLATWGLAAGSDGTPRDVAFCHWTIQQEQVFQVCDAAGDPRFAGNTFVIWAPHIRFYAGVPLRIADGQPVGALCVVDRQPRQLTPDEVNLLEMLGRQTSSLLELRRLRALVSRRD